MPTALNEFIREADAHPDLIEIALTYGPGEALAPRSTPWGCTFEASYDTDDGEEGDEFSVYGVAADEVLHLACEELRRRRS